MLWLVEPPTLHILQSGAVERAFSANPIHPMAVLSGHLIPDTTGVASSERGINRAVVHERTWPLTAVLAASGCIVVGLIWDISWHRTIGRDTFWSAPHVLEQIGAMVAAFTGGWLVLRTTFGGESLSRSTSVYVWGFRGPLGAWVCIWARS